MSVYQIRGVFLHLDFADAGGDLQATIERLLNHTNGRQAAFVIVSLVSRQRFRIAYVIELILQAYSYTKGALEQMKKPDGRTWAEIWPRARVMIRSE